MENRFLINRIVSNHQSIISNQNIMKIGIYSLPFHRNYGGILQSYALHIVLKRMGHNIYVLNKNWIDHPGKRDMMVMLKCVIVNFLFRRKEYSKRQILLESISELKRFWTSNICKLYDFKIHNEIKSIGLDTIIVGSDQIWRKGYCKDTLFYFLKFAKSWNIRRIAYAASFGVSEWQFDNQTTNEMKSLLQLFKGVSVRESDAKSLCEQYFNISPVHVLDPTLLIGKEEYSKFRINSKQKRKKQFVSFMLHPNIEKKMLSKKVADKLGAEVIDIDVPMNSMVNNKIVKYKSVEEWLSALLDADYVLTDSYHGMVFAINFNKQFVTLGNVQGGQSRFVSLLNLFNLSNRMTKDEDEIINLMNEDINWVEVNTILEEKRTKSISFLKNALG